MGKVYKVIDKEINAKVALKLIKPEIAADKKTIERFRNELKMARDISHKNVCPMYDLGKDEDIYYITMEYVDGVFERAIELDPNFALAYAKLTSAYLMLYWIYYFRVDMSLVAKAKEAVDMALKLSPDSPETQWTLGYYYYHGHMDYDRALEHFNQAKKSLEDNSDILTGIAFVQRRQGKYDQAVDNQKKAIDLDPRSSHKRYEIGISYLFMRNYTEAERYFNRAISLAPDYTAVYAWKIRFYLSWEGSTKNGLKVIDEAPQTVQLSEEGYFVLSSVLVHMFNGDYQKALDRLFIVSSDAY